MESVATQFAAPWARALRRVDWAALSASALAGGLVLYLGLDGGGYDIVVRSQVGIVLWWIVLVGAAWGLLPRARLAPIAWLALGLFAGFVAWAALATTLSLSSERSLAELSRVSTYLAVLVLAIAIHRDRQRAVRHTVNGVGAAVVAIAAFALASRLFPTAFTAAHDTGAFLGAGAQGRLSWPLNYWNGLAALIGLGLPLLLSIATSARTLGAQALAAASIPLLALCEYLTFSRGGAVASAVAVLAFLAFAPDRLPKVTTALLAACGGAVLIIGAHHRRAIEQGLTGHAANAQGRQLLGAVVLVGAAVAVGQVGIGLASRHGELPRLLRVSPARARALLVGAILVALAVALAAGAPSRLSHAWNDFKHPTSSAFFSDLPARFGNISGNGRYQWWKVAVQATSEQRFTGSGPGTFQLLWLPRATVSGYVTNAHSLYVETLAEVGIVGLLLLVGFLLVALAAPIGELTRTAYEARTETAATAAALIAFMVSAGVDWVWQLPVLPAAFLLLAAAGLAPRRLEAPVRSQAAVDALSAQRSASGRGRLMRSGLIVTALASLVAIAVPLGTASAVRQSQAAVGGGETRLALSDARSAARLEPGAASPQIQEALVLELEHDYPAALQAARKATRDEPQNWSGWLTLSRLEAESGQVRAAISAYRRARSLNPLSPLFAR